MAIARALATSPDAVVLADEPTGSLGRRRESASASSRIKRERTVIIVTQRARGGVWDPGGPRSRRKAGSVIRSQVAPGSPVVVRGEVARAPVGISR